MVGILAMLVHLYVIKQRLSVLNIIEQEAEPDLDLSLQVPNDMYLSFFSRLSCLFRRLSNLLYKPKINGMKWDDL